MGTTIFTLLSCLLVPLCLCASESLSSSITEEDARAYKDIDGWAPNSLDRLNFLLEEDDWSNLRNEFESIDFDSDGLVNFEEASLAFSEFNDVSNIRSFVDYCDDSGEEGCTFMAFVYSRGAYDRVGAEFDSNEYDMRQSIFVESINRLIATAGEEDLKILGIEVDGDGNIVDDEL